MAEVRRAQDPIIAEFEENRKGVEEGCRGCMTQFWFVVFFILFILICSIFANI